MFKVGIDIGSMTAKIVVLDPTKKKIITWKVIPAGYDTKKTADKLIELILNDKEHLSRDQLDLENVVSTGYSRKNVSFSSKQITEITCQAKGIHYLFPKARTIIDIGGQDSKAILIDVNGELEDFEMNDKCSAGTGRFLEVMSKALEVNLEEMDIISSQAKQVASISSTCTVFAESEVVSRIAQGTPRDEILAGIHESIATKVFSLVSRIGVVDDVVVTGGVANNQAVIKALQEKINSKLLVPNNPQITGALGAALLAIKESKKKISMLNI